MAFLKLLCIGDSLTEGYDINRSDCWTDLLRKDLGIEVINAGISGDTTSGMLARCERLLLEHIPTHCIIMGGTNDLWFGLNDEFILSNIHALRRQISYYNAIPIIGIPTSSMNLNELNLKHENYSECIRTFRNNLIRFCQEDQQDYIDFSLHLLHKHFLTDGIHPNEEGHELMMQNAKEFLQKFIVI